MMLCGAIVGMIRVTLKSAPSSKSRNSDCVRYCEEIQENCCEAYFPNRLG